MSYKVFSPKLTAMHLDVLPRATAKVVTAAVCAVHVSLFVAALWGNTPVDATVGHAGGGSGSGSSGSGTLLVSVMPGVSQTGAVVPTGTPHSALPAKPAGQSLLASTSPIARQATSAVSTNASNMPQKAAPTAPAAGTNPQPAPGSAGRAAAPASGSAGEGAGFGNGASSGTGTGHGQGAGSGSGAGIGYGMGNGSGLGHGDSTAKQVHLSSLSYRHAVKPAYPAQSISRRETGRVLTSVVIDTNGRVVAAKLIASSGFRRLDEAALAAAQASTFYPYKEGGTAKMARATIPYQFNLNTQ